MLTKISKLLVVLFVLAVAGLFTSEIYARRDHRALPAAPDERVARGRALIFEKGCGACHVIPGIRGALGLVGPPLLWWSRRTMIAGQLPNTPANLARWIQAPQLVEPNTAMPTLGLSEEQSQDIAAYLDTLQ